MLSINVSHAKPFLSYPYEEVLCPRLERAQRELLNGGGKGDDFIGWVRLPAQYDRAEYARILAAAKKIQGDSKALVVIGIGGSYLGARGVIECLCSPNYNLKKKDTPNVYFIGNGLSSAALREVMKLIGDDDFSVNVISKSGTTTEPAVAFRFFRERLEQKYGKAGAAQRIYATTDAHKGALKSLADAEGYEEFVVPDNVGGRYSVLTAVGLLPIAVAGVDTDALLAGAREMEALCEIADYTNPAWQQLQEQIRRYGLRNAYIMAVAPTGSTSIIAGTTASTDPILKRYFLEEKRGGIMPRVAPNLNKKTFLLYENAHEIDQKLIIRAAGIRQRHIDQSQSVNIYITPDYTMKQLLELYIQAWEEGLKSIYYVRSKALTVEECEVCSS